MTATHHRPRPRRPGYTVVELVAAGAILAAVTVPALALMRDSIQVGRIIDTRSVITTLCVSKMEEHLALTAASFTAVTDTGSLAVEGYPELRYRVVRSDNPAEGGLTGRLMAVTATVWHDVDGNSVQEADEPSVTFGSKVASMTVYQSEASGT